MTNSITTALDKIDLRFSALEDKAKRISYTLPTEPKRSTLNVQEFISELQKSARISHGRKPR